MSGDGPPGSRRWYAMVEEEEEELVSSGSSSHRSYSDVVRDGTPSPVRAASPEVVQPGGGGSAVERQQPARRLASMISPPEAPRVGFAGARRGLGGRRGPQPKRQRRRAPLPSFSVPAGLAGLCFNCAESGHVAGCCTGPRRCLNFKSEEHVARQCPMPPPPVAGAVAVGAPPPPPRAAPPPPPPHQAAPPPPRVAPSTSVAVEHAPEAPPAAPYRLPAHLRLGGLGPVPDARPSIKDRLGRAGAASRSSVDAGGPVLRPARARELDVEVETPFERGLRRERAIRDAPAGRAAEEQGESSYAQVLRQEQELREAALASVVGGQRASGGGRTVDVAAEISAARPARERCIIYRTHEVDEAERALKWGLVAFVSGTRRAVSCSTTLAAVLERFPALDGHVSVHRYWPSDLLFVFDSRAKRDILLAADPFDGRDFSLRFGVWNRQLQATRRTMRYRVHLEVVGVPAVAWNLATARMILGSSA
ncbi:hypothetical protein ACQ4PT_068843 [Festuca glaucescens]